MTGVTDDSMTIAISVLRELLWEEECALVFLPGLQEITAMMDLLSDASMRSSSTSASRAPRVRAPLWPALVLMRHRRTPRVPSKRVLGLAVRKPAEVFVLHSMSPQEEQDEAMKPIGPGKTKVRLSKRARLSAPRPLRSWLTFSARLPRGSSECLFVQIVLATNLAESSLTIPDVRYVIDFGLQRSLGTDPRLGVASLNLGWISQASAAQRVRTWAICALIAAWSGGSGRATNPPSPSDVPGPGGRCAAQAGRCGRVAPGICIRLYTKGFYENVMPPFDPPGIQRLPLENLLLRVLQLREPLGLTATQLLQRVRGHGGGRPASVSDMPVHRVDSRPADVCAWERGARWRSPDTPTAVAEARAGRLPSPVRDRCDDVHAREHGSSVVLWRVDDPARHRPLPGQALPDWVGAARAAARSSDVP